MTGIGAQEGASSSRGDAGSYEIVKKVCPGDDF